MNKSLAILLVSNNVSLIDVHFGNSDRTYTYKTFLDVEIGDYVVVEVQGDKYSVARVADTDVQVSMNDDGITYRWAFQKVDMPTIERVRDNEEKAVRQVKDAELRSQRRALARELGVDNLMIEGYDVTKEHTVETDKKSDK